MPFRSIPEALEIKNNFDFNTCVDFGCAKGFLVRALRILGYQAYGEDISEYALKSCMPEVKDFLSFPNDKKYDLLISKDVLEHVEEEDLPGVLRKLNNKADQFLFVIPLGDNNKFRIPEYEIDITHVTRRDEEWWIELFQDNGYQLRDFSYSLGAMKEKWLDHHPYGNGFFVLDKKQ